MPLTDFDGNVPPMPPGVGYTPPGFAPAYTPPPIGEARPVRPVKPVSPPSPGFFDPRGAVTIPNNFWGFVMLYMGMR